MHKENNMNINEGDIVFQSTEVSLTDQNQQKILFVEITHETDDNEEASFVHTDEVFLSGVTDKRKTIELVCWESLKEVNRGLMEKNGDEYFDAVNGYYPPQWKETLLEKVSG